MSGKIIFINAEVELRRLFLQFQQTVTAAGAVRALGVDHVINFV